MSSRVDISINRSATNIPWGFTIRGGSDWNETVKITRITENTPASRAGLHSMDVIEVINGVNTGEKTQKECTDLVKAAGLQLNLTILTSQQQASRNAFSTPPPPPSQTKQFHHGATSATLPPPPPPPPPPQETILHHETISTLPPPPPPLPHELHNDSNKLPPPPPPPPAVLPQPTTTSTLYQPPSHGLVSVGQTTSSSSTTTKPIAAYQPSSHGLIPAASSHSSQPPAGVQGGVSDSLSRMRINEPPKRPKPAVIIDSPSSSSISSNNNGNKNQPIRDDPMAPYKVFPDQELYTEIPSRNTTFNKSEIPRCMICLELITTAGFHDVAGNAVCEKDYRCCVCHLNLSGIGCCLEDKKIYCKQHFPSKASLNCARCHEKIANTSVKALNKSWHPNCFSCSMCQKPIGKTSFIAPDDDSDKVICEPCYLEKVAPHCQGCQQPINVEALIVEVAGFKYHEHCLLCAVCGLSLSGKKIARKPTGAFVCAEHANQK